MKKKREMVYLQGLSIWVLVVIMLFGVTGSAYSDKPPGVTDDTIKVGVILDLTGPLARLAAPSVAGFRSLFRYTNEQGGIHGRKLKLLVEDDRSTIPMAISSFKKLVYRDGIVALLGPQTSAAAAAMLRSIEREKVLNIPGSILEKMVDPLQRHVFIVQDTTSGMMKALVDYIMKDFKAKNPRIGLIYPDNESGKADVGPGLERLKLYNLEPVTQEVLNFGAIEASSQVMNLKKANVDYIIICGQVAEGAIVLLREIKKFGLKVPLFGSWGTCDEEIMRIGDAANNFYAVNAMASWYDEGPGVAKMREIVLKYEPGTEKPYRGKIFTNGWVMAMVLIESMKRSGRNLDEEVMVKSLEGMKNFDTGGLTGPISYSPISHKGGSTWKIFKSNPSTGKFIPMTEWRTPQ